jgi:hypothetical protein
MHLCRRKPRNEEKPTAANHRRDGQSHGYLKHLTSKLHKRRTCPLTCRPSLKKYMHEKQAGLCRKMAETHRTLVGLLPGVHPHVDQQFVAGVEGLVPSRAASPEASEVFPLALIYVDLLDVPHQFLLLLIQGTAVYPATAVLAPNVVHLAFII